MLKKIIDWIKAWLWSPSQNKLEAIHYESLEHIDAQGIEKKFKLREEAQRLGAGGVPKQDSKSPSGPEREALNEIEIARRGYQTWATRRLATIDSEFEKVAKLSRLRIIDHLDIQIEDVPLLF